MMIFCMIANHLCMALAFIMCSTFKQCSSVGYVSLLTLSFICEFLELPLTAVSRSIIDLLLGVCSLPLGQIRI